MKIELSKFGYVLTSRPAGKEAFGALRPRLDPNVKDIQIDFSGVISLSPSWADEFFKGLESIYRGRITYLPSDNPSVAATLSILNL